MRCFDPSRAFCPFCSVALPSNMFSPCPGFSRLFRPGSRARRDVTTLASQNMALGSLMKILHANTTPIVTAGVFRITGSAA